MPTSVILKWDKSEKDAIGYRVHYTRLNKGRSKIVEVKDPNKIHIEHLVEKQKYVFKVQEIFKDGGGPYSDDSDVIETRNCVKTSLGFCNIITNGNPCKCFLPMENTSHNEKSKEAKIMKWTIGIIFNLLLQTCIYPSSTFVISFIGA